MLFNALKLSVQSRVVSICTATFSTVCVCVPVLRMFVTKNQRIPTHHYSTGLPAGSLCVLCEIRAESLIQINRGLEMVYLFRNVEL